MLATVRRHSINGSESNQNVILALAPEQNFDSTNSILNNTSDSTIVPEKTHWACHKEVLKATSNYFNTIFDSQFQEAEASIIFLPRGIFGPSVLDDVLYYMYTKSIKLVADDKNEVQELEQLESIYMAADYLGMDQLCLDVKGRILKLTHGLICYCENCTFLIPHLLAFTGQNQQNDPHLSDLTNSILKLLIQVPEKALPTFWSNENLGLLFSETEDLHNYLETKLLEHVNKNNAIETLHGCFLSFKKGVVSEKKEDYWSFLIRTQERVQQASSKLLADHLEFYCTKYPKLLSCVDGITYSFEFLNYLLTSVLCEINEYNAISLYKCIIRHLIYRDAVQQNTQVKSTLQSSKKKTIRFIATHLDHIKKLDLIDKSIVEPLAHDLVVPMHTILADDDSKTIASSKSNNTHSQQKKHVAQHSSNNKPTKWEKRLRSRLCTMVFGQPALHFKIGQRVKLTNRPVDTFGTIAFVGKLDNHKEQFLGIELDRSVGTSDGTIDGKQYFITSPNKGIFVKPSQVILI